MKTKTKQNPVIHDLPIDCWARLGVQLTLQPCFLPRRAASRDFVATLQVHRVVVVFFLDIGL